jgi:hypothetical protein
MPGVFPRQALPQFAGMAKVTSTSVLNIKLGSIFGIDAGIPKQRATSITVVEESKSVSDGTLN